MTDQIDRLSGVIGNIAMKAPARVASTANLTLSGLQTIDGIGINVGDRVLAKDQTNLVENGIWVCDTGDWERAKDFDGQYDAVEGTLVRVNVGSANHGSFWAVSTVGTILPGTSSISFVASTSVLVGVTSIGAALITAANQAAARSAIDVPSNAEALLDAIMDAKGDLVTASAADTPGRKAAGVDGSALVADSTQTDGLNWILQYPRSIAPNPFFQIDQRVNSVTSRADDVYCLDRWYVLTQTNTINVSKQTAQENGQPFNVRLTQAQAVAQRMGIATIIEGKDCKHLRGQTVTFRPRVRISNSQAVRIAVLEWTGTEDTVTSDVVNDWTSGDYTDGAAKFFVDAGFTPSGNGAKTPSAATWTDMDALTVTLGSTFNNLVLVAWTEGTAAQNVTLDIGKARFVVGSYAGEIAMPTFSDELLRCMRYYQKTFNYAQGPGQAFGDQGALGVPVIVAGAVTNSILGMWEHGVRLRNSVNSPIFYSPQAVDAFAYNFTKSTSATATAFLHIGEARTAFVATGLAGWAVGDSVQVHATRDAEL